MRQPSRDGHTTSSNITLCCCCLKKNLNASKPSNYSKGLGGNIGCRDKNSTTIVVAFETLRRQVRVFFLPCCLSLALRSFSLFRLLFRFFIFTDEAAALCSIVVGRYHMPQ